MDLVTGFPRSGTKFIATLLEKMGVDMPHEGIGRHGTVSWFQAGSKGRVFNKTPDPTQFDRVIHVVRNPVNVLRSVHTFRDEAWNFIEENVGPLPSGDVLIKGMTAWLRWNRMIEELPNYTWRFNIEDDLAHLLLFPVLGYQKPDVLPELSPKINSRNCEPITFVDLCEADPFLADEVRVLAKEYGYYKL